MKVNYTRNEWSSATLETSEVLRCRVLAVDLVQFALSENYTEIFIEPTVNKDQITEV